MRGKIVFGIEYTECWAFCPVVLPGSFPPPPPPPAGGVNNRGGDGCPKGGLFCE